MALSARMVWEVRDTGSDTLCSGGYRGKKAVNAAPSTPGTSTATTGGTVAANTYYIVVTYTDPYGDTVMSGIATQVTTGATSTIMVTSPPAASVTYNEQSVAATSWNCYVGTLPNGPFFPQGTTLTIGSNRVITTTPPTTGTQPLGSSDYSQQNSAQINVDGATITGTVQATTTQLKLTGATVSATDVGNTYNNTGGTSTAGVYEIIGIVGTDTWVMDRSMGTSTQTSTGYMGGCFASIGKAGSVRVAGNLIWLKRGTADAPYDLSSSSNVAGGRLSLSGTEPITIEGPGGLFGYNATRGDAGTDRAVWPIVQPSANSMNCVTLNAANEIVQNVQFKNGNANTLCEGIRCEASGPYVYRCYFNSLSYGIRGNVGTPASVMFCEFDSTTLYGFRPATNGACLVVACYAHDCSGNAAFDIPYCTALNCIAANNSSNGFSNGSTNVSAMAVNCIAYGGTSGGNGFIASAASAFLLINCISASNSGRNYSGNSNSSGGNRTVNCASYNGTSPDINIVKSGFITLTANPFTNAGAGDFSLNTTAGGGAACRAAGIPGVFPGGTTTGYLDIGAAQSNGGTVTVPAEADVLAGVMYGAGGTQYTGTLVAGGGGVPTSIGIFRGRK